MKEVEPEAQAISAAEAAAIICGNFDDRKSLDSSRDLEKLKAKEELTEEICQTPVVKKRRKREKKISESACSSGGRGGASSTPRAKVKILRTNSMFPKLLRSGQRMVGLPMGIPRRVVRYTEQRVLCSRGLVAVWFSSQ